MYWGQTISLVGDAFTWVGLALLAYQIDSKRSSEILATALTIRVTAFILIAPIAGVIADRWDRKRILYVTHFVRMAVVCCLPFVAKTWQIYGLVFFLNVFNALFTPTYRAVIPQIIEMPSETLIGENVEGPDQGKVYGAHFAVSHLWWAIAYPLAGYLGTSFPEYDFLYSGLLTAAAAIVAAVILYPRKG